MIQMLVITMNRYEDTSEDVRDFYQNLKPMQVTVLKTIKGSIQANAALQIAEYGGTAGGITEIYDNLFPWKRRRPTCFLLQEATWIRHIAAGFRYLITQTPKLLMENWKTMQKTFFIW